MRASNRAQAKGRPSMLARVLLTGAVATLLVVAALVFDRMGTGTDHGDLERISVDFMQPLLLLNDISARARRSNETMVSGVHAESNAASTAAFADALDQTGPLTRSWEEFKATPARFDGEEQLRQSVDSGVEALRAAGQQLAVAVVGPAPDPATIAGLELTYIELSQSVGESLEALEADLYLPGLERALDEHAAVVEARRDLTTVLLALAAVLGPLTMAVGYRLERAAGRIEQRERDRQQQVAAENALDSQLQYALEMAGTDDRVHRVMARALAVGHEVHSTDVLLAPSRTAAFELVGALDESCGPRCPVPTPDDCPAAKHGQTLVVTDPEALDACTYLLEHDQVPAASVCVPLSIGGEVVGVVHETFEEAALPPSHRVRELEIIARKTGDRLAVIRAFARSEVQAHTDPLTGLLNRRSLDDALERLTQEQVDYTLAFADLDHFKVLNDTYGHDVGDRALRLFCNVMRANVRPDDIAARYGGEEFVVVLPGCTPVEAVPVLQRVQAALAVSVGNDGVPPFTVSIGVASSHQGSTFDDVLMLADGCLLRAKAEGRDRIVVAGQDDAAATPAVVPAIPT